jgi:hypothetical protein
MRPRGRSAVRALQGLKEDNCVPRSATSGPETDPAAVRGRHPAHPQPANLLPDQVQSPDRFYAISSRDFTAVFAR